MILPPSHRPLGTVLDEAMGPSQSSPPRIPDHELLRRIGRGSYGHVWLARNILGEWRAVKVVYRSSFEDERPFHREFEGIQKFEPISRSHPSQLAILHVGRNEAAAYFYYVMELADDGGERSAVSSVSGVARPALSEAEGCEAEGRAKEGQSSVISKPVVDHAHVESGVELSAQSQAANQKSLRQAPDRSQIHYVPHTLKLALQHRASLPSAECVEIGLALTTALEHLHAHGLVHRDIKPSNIIFVNGRPKLADIGLVTDAGDGKSIVGTEGYLPPEGPGTPRADIYSLGRVLYEISTGRDRRDFPDLPLDWKDRPDWDGLLEINEILLKACAHDWRDRYSTAIEMRGELELLQSGRSVQGKRVAQRRLAWARKLSLAVGVSALVTAGIWPLLDRFHDSTRQRSGASVPREVNSIAVLPFVNESIWSGHEYLSDALTVETMNALTSCPGLRVIPRQAVFAFKRATKDVRQIGQQLGVRTVLAGTFLRHSNGMHLAARLLNVGDGTQLWSEKFERGREELGALGADVIGQTTRVLGLTLGNAALDGARTNLMRKLGTYRLYSQASTNMRNTQVGLDRGIQLLNQALAEDSDCAPAYAELAYRYNEAVPFYLPPGHGMTAAKMNALRALQLDDSLSLAHRALAFVYSRHELDLARARPHFQRAIELLPNDGETYADYSYLLSHFGLFNEAEQLLKRGEQVDPKDHNLLCAWCWRYYLDRDFEKAKQAANRLMTEHPNSVIVPWFLALSYEGLRQYDEALGMTLRMIQLDSSPDAFALAGRLRARLGHREEAQKALEAIVVLSQSPGGARTYSAEVLLALGENDRALEHLERAVEEYPPAVLSLKAHPIWDELRPEPRFQALLRKAGLEQ